MGRMTLITGDERRRRWSDADRARILAEIEAPGAVVAEVARRADICTSLVYKWRREARRSAGASTSGFAPVLIEASPVLSVSPPVAGEPSVIVVEVNEARVRIGAGAPSALTKSIGDKPGRLSNIVVVTFARGEPPFSTRRSTT